MPEKFIGRIINNRFRVDSILNFQGKGFAYEVWDLQDDVPLLMRLLPNYEDHPSAYTEAVREANRVSKLSHGNIVPFYGLYKGNNFSFTLEKYIDGGTLGQILNRRVGEHLQIGDALIIFKAISSALTYAHSSGVVHGDIQPKNIMVSKEGYVYLTGFRINQPLTTGSIIEQDPEAQAYTAPEIIHGGPPSLPADIYAEGVLLMEILTGEREIDASDNEAAKQQLAEKILVRQTQLAVTETDVPRPIVEISDDLAEVILKALEKNPADRYQSAKNFFLALCKAARIFINEIPAQLFTNVPVTGAGVASYHAFETLNDKPRSFFSFLRLPSFEISPSAGAILGAIISVILIGALLFFSGVLTLRQTSNVLPGYAYVDDGEVMYQIPGGQPMLIKKGTSISTGPGSLIAVGKSMATLLLPGDYRLILAGDPTTVIELVQETNNQTTTSVVKLLQGSLFLFAGQTPDKNRPVYIQTVSGRATLSGLVMGSRFDHTSQIFSVDCVEGQCRLQADETVNLTSGQRSQVDSSGIPIDPAPMNLGLYRGFDLGFIPQDILAQAPASALQSTPTPNPTIPFTPTPIPPTWTPTPTAAPQSGYGH